MKKTTVKLYVNDPMGKRWAQNTDAARRAEKDLGAEIVVIKKTSEEYKREKDPLPCPSIVLNGKVLANNGTITYEELKAEIQKQK